MPGAGLSERGPHSALGHEAGSTAAFSVAGAWRASLIAESDSLGWGPVASFLRAKAHHRRRAGGWEGGGRGGGFRTEGQLGPRAGAQPRGQRADGTGVCRSRLPSPLAPRGPHTAVPTTACAPPPRPSDSRTLKPQDSPRVCLQPTSPSHGHSFLHSASLSLSFTEVVPPSSLLPPHLPNPVIEEVVTAPHGLDHLPALSLHPHSVGRTQ